MPPDDFEISEDLLIHEKTHLQVFQTKLKKQEIIIRKVRANILGKLLPKYQQFFIKMFQNRNSLEVSDEPSSFATQVGMRFNKWPIVEFVNFEGSDFRKHYQMELVTIVFLLSLRSLKNFITNQKLKIDSDGAQ